LLNRKERDSRLSAEIHFKNRGKLSQWLKPNRSDWALPA